MPYTLLPVAGLATRLGYLWCQISKGDVLLSDKNLDWAGQRVGSTGSGGNSRGIGLC
jgi:hypothetical protein